ncbi:MAG: hypothetical protein WCP70_04260 [Methanothrix sp.]
MSAAKVQEVSSGPTPGAVMPIEQLPFVAARLSLLRADPHDAHARHHAQDRTFVLVHRWKVLVDQLPMIRSSTMGCLEAVEGKNGITFRIANREKYDTIQTTIREHSEQITRLEIAMRELDSVGCGWLDEMRSQRDSLAGAERQARSVLSSWASAAIQKNFGKSKSAEESLAEDPIYQAKKAGAEARIAKAKAELADLVPRLERIEDILSGVGC